MLKKNVLLSELKQLEANRLTQTLTYNIQVRSFASLLYHCRE